MSTVWSYSRVRVCSMADQDDDSWLYGEDGDEMEEVRSDVMNITTVPCACRNQQQRPRLR